MDLSITVDQHGHLGEFTEKQCQEHHLLLVDSLYQIYCMTSFSGSGGSVIVRMIYNTKTQICTTDLNTRVTTKRYSIKL